MKTTFRPTPEQQSGLAKIAQSLGPTFRKSDVMSIAVDALISYWAKHNGRLLLPLNFDETFIAMPRQEAHRTLYEPPKQRGSNRAEGKDKRSTARH